MFYLDGVRICQISDEVSIFLEEISKNAYSYPRFRSLVGKNCEKTSNITNKDGTNVWLQHNGSPSRTRRVPWRCAGEDPCRAAGRAGPMIQLLPPSRSPGLGASVLRDALRGVTHMAGLAQDALHPISPHLPYPLRDAIEGGLRTLKTLTREENAAPLDAATLERARAFVDGRSDRAADAEACARCLGFVWEHLRSEPNGLQHTLFSEAVTTRLLCKLAECHDSNDNQRAADILDAIIGSGAILLLPGSPVVTETETELASEDAVSSALVWLLAAKGTSTAQELALLDMAQALIRAKPGETALGKRSRTARTAQLRNLAAQL